MIIKKIRRVFKEKRRLTLIIRFILWYNQRNRQEGVHLKELDMERIDENDDTNMTVEIELTDGQKVTCAIITILTVNSKDYIVLLPLDEDGQSSEGEVWFYGYKEDENDPNVEPELIYIDDDDEYEAVADAFDEYLDNEEFEMMKD